MDFLSLRQVWIYQILLLKIICLIITEILNFGFDLFYFSHIFIGIELPL